MGARVELAVDCRCDLGESPVWYKNRLYFVDINGKRAYEAHEPSSPHLLLNSSRSSAAVRSVDLGRLVGCVVPRRSGGLVACLEDTIEGFSFNVDDATRVDGGAPIAVVPPEHRARPPPPPSLSRTPFSRVVRSQQLTELSPCRTCTLRRAWHAHERRQSGPVWQAVGGDDAPEARFARPPPHALLSASLSASTRAAAQVARRRVAARALVHADAAQCVRARGGVRARRAPSEQRVRCCDGAGRCRCGGGLATRCAGLLPARVVQPDVRSRSGGFLPA